jgi:hypothetical protein
MAAIFLSYRRSDGAQASRVHDWLVRRFGADAVFMDVADIPIAADFPDTIREAIGASTVMLVLIGPQWAQRIQEPGDVVRMELEHAVARGVAVLPLLVGTTPMPDPQQLPPTIAGVALRNAMTVGTLRDFDSHMQMLLPRLEAVLGAGPRDERVSADPQVIQRAMESIAATLRWRYAEAKLPVASPEWSVVGTEALNWANPQTAVTLYLHRIARVADTLELHLLLTFWSFAPAAEQMWAGWVVREFERTPILPADALDPALPAAGLAVKVRSSDEDPRQLWKLVSSQPLRLSLAYVASVVPARPE